MTRRCAALPDLASRRLGGGVVAANDELFAAADNLVDAEPPVFEPHTFGPKGQVYDGWETRRRRTPGHDWAIVRLGAPGVVRGVVVDTAFFTGNYPPYASVEACRRRRATRRRPSWPPPTGCRSCRARRWPATAATRSRSTCRPAVHPRAAVDLSRTAASPGCACTARSCPTRACFPDGWLDLAALENGGLVVGCSDMFYGSPHQPARARPGPHDGRGLGDRAPPRRRQRLGAGAARPRPARIRLAELDTTPLQGQRAGRGAAARHRRPRVRCGRSGGVVRAAAPHRPAARHPAPVPGRRRARRPPTSGSTSTPTAAWPGCACTAASTPACSTRCAPPGRAERRAAGAGNVAVSRNPAPVGGRGVCWGPVELRSWATSGFGGWCGGRGDVVGDVSSTGRCNEIPGRGRAA